MPVAPCSNAAMPAHGRYRLLSVLLACLLPAMAACATPMTHRAHVLRITVLDSASGRPLPHIGVTIDSDNGIRCIKAPCPTHSIHWTGRTNGRGVAMLPGRVVQSSMTITARGHAQGKDLVRDASKTTPYDWAITLDPDR